METAHMEDDLSHIDAHHAAMDALPKIATMEDYQMCVIAERDDLKAKAARLAAFCDTPAHDALPQTEKDRLFYRLKLMNEYSAALDARIAAFPQS
jgi:hypothetical protein